jgi:DNA modification methylase
LNLEYAPIVSLSPLPRNARKHSERNLSVIKQSLKECGQQKPIVVDAEGIVIAGNGTMAAALSLGWDKIWVLRTSLDKKRADLFAILDNRTAELAEWDAEELTFALDDLDKQGWELKEFGWDDKEREKMRPKVVKEGLCDDDEVPEQVDTRCKLGDLWHLGDHRILCGDSTDVLQIERLMGIDKADMVFTDPPYGINESAKKRASRETNSIAKTSKHLAEFKDDSIQYAIDAYNICEAMKIPRQVWWGANYYCHSLPQSNNWFVWDKRVDEKYKDNNSDCELAWVKSKWSSVRIFRHLWKGLMKASEKGEARIHPTQKPVELAIWSFDYFKDVKSVLDLFLGSGSTLIACEKTQRRCFGMELDPHYCDVILARWEKFTGKTALMAEENQHG